MSPRRLVLALLACSLLSPGCRQAGRGALAPGSQPLPAPRFVELLAEGRHDAAFGLTCPEYRTARDLGAFRAALSSVPYLEGMREARLVAAERSAGLHRETVSYGGPHGSLRLELHSREHEGRACVAGLVVFGAELLWRARPGAGRATPELEGEAADEEDGARPAGATVEVLLDSQPTAARVYRADDGYLCETPCRVPLARGTEVELRFELSGYRLESRTIVAERDTVLLVRLSPGR